MSSQYESHYELVSEVLTDFNVDCAMKACKRKLTTAAPHQEVSKCSRRRMAIVGILIGS